jgi:hypothetical protein
MALLGMLIDPQLNSALNFQLLCFHHYANTQGYQAFSDITGYGSRNRSRVVTLSSYLMTELEALFETVCVF